MKKEYFELSLKNGQRAFSGMSEVNADVWTTECPLAALQFKQATGREPLHPIEVLDRAYRADGFVNRVGSHQARTPADETRVSSPDDSRPL